MGEIIYELLTELSTKEVQPALYLSLGVMGPDFNRHPLGIKEKSAITILASVAGINENDISKQFEKIIVKIPKITKIIIINSFSA